MIWITLILASLCIQHGMCGKCKDDEGLIFPNDGENLKCNEFIAKYPCQCRSVFQHPLRTIVVKKDCCKSCKAADLSDCDCQNLISPSQPITIPRPDDDDIVIESCEELANDWPELCDKFGNKQKTPCCKACKGVSTDCLDSRLASFNTEDAEGLTCAEFIGEDKCNCAVAAEHCCQSCKSVDIDECCLNDPTFKATIKIKGNKKKNIKKRKCKKCDCRQLLEKDPILMAKACRDNINGAAKRCCKSCEALKNPIRD